jgi:hypothetical protein
VIITISDVNDKRPVFEDVAASRSESCSVVTEFHELNEPVVTVRADDDDDPATPNGQIVFRFSDKFLF